MKKKVLYGAALALFASVSMGTLQSCKDDLADLRTQVDYTNKDFSTQIAALQGDVAGLQSALASCKSTCGLAIADLRNKVSQNQKDIVRLEGEIDALKKADAANEAKINDLQQQLNAKVSALQTSLKHLYDVVASMKSNEEIDRALAVLKRDLMEYTNTSSNAVKSALTATINNEVSKLNTKIANLQTGLQNQINTLDQKYADKLAVVNNELNNFNSRLTELSTKYNTLLANYNALLPRINTLEANYESQLAAINAANQEIEELWKNSQEQSELISQVYKSLTDDITELGKKYADLAQEHDQLLQDIFGEGGLRDQMESYYNLVKLEFTEADEELWHAIEERDITMTQLMNSLRQEFTEADEEIYLTIDQVRNEASMYWFATQAALDELKEENADQWTAIENLRDEASMYWFATQNAFEELKEEIKTENEEQWLAIEEVKEFLTQALNAHQADIEELDGKIAELQTQYDNLLGRVNDLITGIIIQSTDNPIFGNFSLPLGIKSNMLFNWYGQNNGREYNFPSAGKAYTYNSEEPVLTAEDLNFLKTTKVEIPNDLLGEVSLGKVYVTINPTGHNFDNTALKLESTDGQKLPYELRVKKSDDKLYWGASTRAENTGNGFYEADVVMPANWGAVNKTKIEIEDGLKSAAKDLLKDRTKRNALNMLKAIHGQMADMLPMYGVSYNWTSSEKNYSVLSNYDLAVATAKPLSYKFLYDKSISKRLPIKGHINNVLDNLIDKNKFKFDLDTSFKIDSLTISFDDLELNLSVEPDIAFNDSIVVTVQIPDMEGTGRVPSTGEEVTVTVPGKPTTAVIKGDDLKPLIDAISEGFSKSIASMDSTLNTQINDQIRTKLISGIQDQVNKMLNNIQGQITDMLDSLEGNINKQVGDMIDEIMGTIKDKTTPIFKRVNQAIDLYNRVAEKINNVLEDPNHYLQVAMFYKGNGTVGLLSNSKYSPTPFKGTGDYIALFPSSYSGEIIAPAFKKFVAVTNAYKKNDKGEMVSVRDAEKNNIAKMNSVENGLNTVIDGKVIRINMPASSMTKGVVYEIVYQGVDYSGITSTQKFYITVK